MGCQVQGFRSDRGPTCSLHCSSFLGLPYRILVIYLVEPKKELTQLQGFRVLDLGFRAFVWLALRTFTLGVSICTIIRRLKV